MKRILIFIMAASFQLPAAAAAEPGVSETAVILGSSMPFTGILGQRAKELQSATNIVLNKVNRAGGVHGRKIEITYLDDQYEPKLTLENTRSLIQDKKVFALYNYLGTPGVNAVKTMIEQSKIPMLTPYTGAMSIRNPVNPFIFNTRPGFNIDAMEITNHIVKKLKKTKIGIFYQDDSFGIEGKTEMNKVMSAQNLRFVVEGKHARGDSSFAGDLEKIIQAKPEVVVTWCTEAMMIKFIKEAAQKGFKPIFISPFSAFGPNSVHELSDLGADVYFAMTIPFYVNSQSDILRQYFEDAVIARENPSVFGFEAYLNATLLVETLKKVGTDLTRVNFMKALESIENLSLGGISLNFNSKQHVGMSGGSIIQISNKHVTTVRAD